MSPTTPQQSDYVPRRYHEQQVTALTIRSLTAENNLVALLDFIDSAIVERHHGDWLAAVKELLHD